MTSTSVRRQPAPGVGDLLPAFTLRATDGTEIKRTAFKGRAHLVLLFLDASDCGRCQQLLARLGEMHDALASEQARVLAIVPAGQAKLGSIGGTPFPVLADDGRVAARYGVMEAAGQPTAALFVADRYGEIVLAGVAEDRDVPRPGHGLPVDRVLPIVELLQVRCGL